MNKYAEFFLESKRLEGKKVISLVKSHRYEEFIRTLVADDSIKSEYKVFLICCISAGLRVSEGLSLTKENFLEDNNKLFFRVKVLKGKNKEDTRWCMVDPDATILVKKVLASKIGKLFDWTPVTCLRRAKALFGLNSVCNHSLRHSAVSYYLFEKRMSSEETAKLVHINPYIINYYAHLDERATLVKMHSNRVS